MVRKALFYLFFVCLYEKRFRVLYQLLAPSVSLNIDRCHLLRELAEFVPNHILRYPNIVVDLPVVDLEDKTDEVG